MTILSAGSAGHAGHQGGARQWRSARGGWHTRPQGGQWATRTPGQRGEMSVEVSSHTWCDNDHYYPRGSRARREREGARVTRAHPGRRDWTLPAPQDLTVSIMWSGAIVCTLSDVMSPGLPIPSCGWRTGPQLGPDTDLAIATGNNKQDKPGQNSEYSNKSDLNSGKLVSVEYKRLLHGVGWIVFKREVEIYAWAW